VARVLFVVNSADFFVSHRMALGVAALDRGHDVHVATPVGPGAERIARAGMTFHEVPLHRSAARPGPELLSVVSLVRLYAALAPDLVHHVTIKPVLYGGLASRLLKVPAVVHAVSGLGYVFLARGRVAAVRRALVRSAYRSAFRHPNLRVIFQNEDDRDDFVRERLVRPDDTTIIRGSGVDLTEFTPSPEPPAPVTVLFPGRMLADKGVRELVDAARVLRREGHSLRVLLAGPTDRANPASVSEAELHGWEREGVVEWLGQRDDMPTLFRSAHIVCLPSYREGLPKALLEAAASARAIITTDVPGCREVVREGDNGLLVPVRDALALATALRRLCVDAAERARMGARSRARAEAEFSVERVAGQTMHVYDELLAHRGAPTSRAGGSALHVNARTSS
jgi:glycosyltransferase involved in cell wall biosynthesis